MRRYYRSLLSEGKVTWIAILAFAGFIEILAALDITFDLGFGYQPRDLLIGVLILLGATLLHFVVSAWIRFVARMDTAGEE